MMVLTSTLNMDRGEWLEARKQGLGGSDAAAVAGLSRWKTPLDVYLDKKGLSEQQDMSEAAEWGIKLEELVAQKFAEETGFRIQRRNAILQHPEYPFMLANVDRFVTTPEGRGVLECKTTSAYNSQEWRDRVPDEYLLQVQHYLAVTGLQFGYLAVLIGGQHYKHVKVERDEVLIDFLIHAESEFWRLVESETPPDAIDSNGLALLYPDSKPDTILLPSEAEKWIGLYEQASQDEKDAGERKEAAAFKLKSLLGENEAGSWGERRVIWKAVSSKRLDTNGLKKAHPSIYEQFCKESTSRRFSIK